jgi:Lrp/AsnC family transcriptional regulator, leucine-responsive regulatory protein
MALHAAQSALPPQPPLALDAIHLSILRILQADARTSYSALARQVGLSTPAVIERVRKLEDAGIITGYCLGLNLEALGYSVSALIEVKTDPMRYEKIIEFARKTPEIRECYFVTGESSFVARVVSQTVGDLQQLIQKLGMYGSTRTSVVLSSPVIKTQFEL